MTDGVSCCLEFLLWDQPDFKQQNAMQKLMMRGPFLRVCAWCLLAGAPSPEELGVKAGQERPAAGFSKSTIRFHE